MCRGVYLERLLWGVELFWGREAELVGPCLSALRDGRSRCGSDRQPFTEAAVILSPCTPWQVIYVRACPDGGLKGGLVVA